MPPARKADVIVVADRMSPLTSTCLEQVLACGGPELNRLIVVVVGSAEPALERLAQGDPRVVILHHADGPGDVLACNQGLVEREGDAVLLAATARVTKGWLSELGAVAHSEERTAFAWPLSNAGLAIASVGIGGLADLGEEVATKAFPGLPESTAAPSIEEGCVYLRGRVLDAIGLLDSGLATCQAALGDWAMRALSLGFFGKRANRVYVYRPRVDRGAGEGSFLNRSDRSVLDQRHPHFSHQVASFDGSLDGRLAGRALDFVRTGKLRVAYDIRQMPRQSAGTRTYAFNLAKALSRLPQIELSFLVDTPAQAQGLDGPVIMSEEWRDDFAVIHTPAQFLARQELSVLFGSSAHLVITYHDLTADRVETVFRNDVEIQAHRTTSGLSLLCAQAILACSESSRREIALELGIPDHDIAVTPVVVETDRFDHCEPANGGKSRELELPDGPGAPLRPQGLEQVELSCWERAARSTFEVYRAAVLRPSDRSLQMRRLMREATLSWSGTASGQSFVFEDDNVVSNDRSMSVRGAWKALNVALKRRAGREIRRFHVTNARKRA